MDIAILYDSIYLLEQNGEDGYDIIYKLNHKNGKTKAIFKIGKTNSVAITSKGNYLWILSRSNRNFLRRIDQNGNIKETISLDNQVDGMFYGFAINGNDFFFTANKNGASTVYKFNKESGLVTKIISVNGKIYSLTFLKDRLYAYQNNFDVYSSNWLLIIDPKKRDYEKINFINITAWGLSNEGNNIYLMRRTGKKAKIYPVAVLKDKGIVLGNPKSYKVKISYDIMNKNKNPFKYKLWIPVPENRQFQNIKNLVITPKPSEYIIDKFGNKWALLYWGKLKAGTEATISFDILAADIAFSINKQLLFGKANFPQDIITNYTSETHSFNYSEPIIKEAISKIKKKDNYLEQIIEIRNYVNNSLAITGPTGQESKASDHLSLGTGRCYAHTIVFAALARGMKIPVRAIGGLPIGSDKTTSGEHTWNQVYFPGSGWIDVDVQLDDRENNSHSYNHLGFRTGTLFISFVGDYDELDHETIFTKRGWYSSYWWYSIDRKNRADVASPGWTSYSEKLDFWED